MNDNRDGNTPTSSGWDDAPWQSSLSGSSLSDSSLSGADDSESTPTSAASADDAPAADSAPNPFSREGSNSGDALIAPPASAASASAIPAPEDSAPPSSQPSAPSTAPPVPQPYEAMPPPPPQQQWPSYPQSAPEAATYNPVAGPPPAAYGASADRPPVAPGFDPQPTGPYGSAGQGQGYGQTPPPYDLTPQPYGGNAYAPAPNPYQPSYGGYTPYGVAPVTHPKATPALICGIIGLVLGLSCGLGGLVGIAGIVNGRKARADIDADPQRYTGRGMASAGIGLGVAGLVIMAGYTLLFVLLGLTGSLNN